MSYSVGSGILLHKKLKATIVRYESGTGYVPMADTIIKDFDAYTDARLDSMFYKSRWPHPVTEIDCIQIENLTDEDIPISGFDLLLDDGTIIESYRSVNYFNHKPQLTKVLKKSHTPYKPVIVSVHNNASYISDIEFKCDRKIYTDYYYPIKKGSHKLYVKIYEDLERKKVSGWCDTGIVITGHPTDVVSVTVSTTKDSYYKNEVFNTDSISVKASFIYHVAQTIEGENEVNGYTITSPDTTTSGSKNVTVSYGGKTASFNIYVYGISQYEKPTLKKYFKQNESIGSNLTSKITYEDDTTETVNVTVSGFDSSEAGKKTITYTATATKTGETLTWTSEIEVMPVTSITLNADSCKKNYDFTDELSISGLVVTAHYGANDEAGTEILSNSDVTTSVDDWSVGKDKQVTVTYGDYFATYNININGLAELDVNIENCALYDGNDGFRMVRNTPFTSANKTASVRRYLNGVLQAATTWSGTINQDVDLDNGKVTFSVTEDGVTVSQEFPLTQYETTELEVINYTDTYFIRDGVNPTLQLGEMVVNEFTDDGQSYALTYGATSKGFNVSPAIGSTLPKGDTEVTITSTSGLVSKFTVTVQDNAPKQDATLTVTGTLNKSVYVTGESLDKSGLTVKVSEMMDGEKDYVVPFNMVIVDTEGTVITEDLEVGTYDVLISVDGVDDTVTLEDAITVDGIVDVEDVVSEQTYKSGQTLDKNFIKGKLVLLSGAKENIKPSDIETEARAVHYGEDEEFALTIRGIDTTVELDIIAIDSISVALKTGKSESYINGEAFNRENYTATKTYTDGSTEEIDVADLAFSITNGSENSLEADDGEATAEITLSYTEDGITKSVTRTIYVKEISSAVLYDENLNEIDYLLLDYNQVLSMSGYSVFVTFNDGTTEQLDVTKVICDGSNVLGEKVKSKLECSVSAVCGKQKVEIPFVIHCSYLSDVEVDFSSISEELYAYDSLDVSGITGKAIISSTDEDDENYPVEDEDIELLLTIDGQNIEEDTITLPDAGTHTLAAIYELNGIKITKTKTLSISAVTLESISLVKGASFKDLEDYVEDQNLSLDGLEIELEYNREASNRTISFSDPKVELIDSNDEKFSKSKLLSLLDDGVELFIRYEDKVESLGTLAIEAKDLSSIEIVNNPTKTTYTYGDIFSIDGMFVKANFNNGSSNTVALTDLEVSGVAIGHEFNPTDDAIFGTITITLSYTYGDTTKTTSFEITLVKPEIDHLETNINEGSGVVQTQFKDLSLFSLSGLIVTAVMKNGWTCEVTTLVNDATTVLNIGGDGKINVSGAYGFKDITISGTNPYNNTDIKTVVISIEVISSGQIISALLKLDGDYNKYVIGDKFTAKGVSFVVTDVDGNTWNAANFSTDLQIGTTLRSSQRITVKATYTNGSYTKTEEFQIIVMVPNSVDVTETSNYQLAIGKANGDLFTEITHEEATIKLGKVYDDYGNLIGEFYPVFHEDKISVDDNPLHTNTVGFNVYTGTDAEHDCIGYMDLGIGDTRNAHLVLFDDPINPIDGDSNIEVLFPHYVKGAADRINNCEFGVVYNNRLFVSGNSNFKNMDFHSSETNDENNEFTYFSDLDYCKYGSDNTAVVGYDYYRDGDLIVFKESSRNEASVYRRETKLIEAIDYTGNAVEGQYEESYPCFPINNGGGIGAYSFRSITNLGGETLFVTEQGVKALTNKEDVYSDAKFTFDVSSFINSRIKKENLAGAILFAYKDKVILRTNKAIYIGYNNLRNEDNEYEWYVLNGISADIFFEIDSQLYFANNRGEIFRFNELEKEYIDKKRVFVGVGGTTLDIDEAGNKVVVSGTYANQIKEGYSFHLITEYKLGEEDKRTQVHASLGMFVNKNTRVNSLHKTDFDQTLYIGEFDAENNVVEIKPRLVDGSIDKIRKAEHSRRFYDGRAVYFDKLQGSGMQVDMDKLYYLKEVDTDKYQVIDSSNRVVDLIGVETARMSFVVNDLAITTIKDVEPFGENGLTFKLVGDHDFILDLINYGDIEERTYKGVITIPSVVKAYYVTAPFVMGSLINMKTIWQWVIANDTNLASAMDVGYFSSSKQGDYDITIKSSVGSRQFGLDNFSFERVQFTSDKLPHIYQRRRVVPRVGFIRFLFKNDEPTNMVLTALELVYSISSFTKGER